MKNKSLMFCPKYIKVAQSYTELIQEKYCLPIALELGRIHHDEKLRQKLKKENKLEGWPLLNYASFQRLIQNGERQKEIGKALLKACKISRKLEDYGIQELEIIQRHYDQIYPNMYRIVAFSEESKKMPIW